MTRSGSRPARASVACAEELTEYQATAAWKEAACQSPAAEAAAGVAAYHRDGHNGANGSDGRSGSGSRRRAAPPASSSPPPRRRAARTSSTPPAGRRRRRRAFAAARTSSPPLPRRRRRPRAVAAAPAPSRPPPRRRRRRRCLGHRTPARPAIGPRHRVMNGVRPRPRVDDATRRYAQDSGVASCCSAQARCATPAPPACNLPLGCRPHKRQFVDGRGCRVGRDATPAARTCGRGRLEGLTSCVCVTWMRQLDSST